MTLLAFHRYHHIKFMANRLVLRKFNQQKRPLLGACSCIGGEWGIRTRGCCYTSTVFKTAAIDHSANSPAQKYKYDLNLQTMR